VQILDHWGLGRFTVDRMLSEDAGPNKSEWAVFTGIYSISESSIVYYAAVSIQNGYLNISGWMGEVRLREHRSAMFFTTDGEVVIFTDEGLFYGNAFHSREFNPYQQIVNLAKTNPKDRKLTDGALLRLAEAFQHLNESRTAKLILEVKRNHPAISPS